MYNKVINFETVSKGKSCTEIDWISSSKVKAWKNNGDRKHCRSLQHITYYAHIYNNTVRQYQSFISSRLLYGYREAIWSDPTTYTHATKIRFNYFLAIFDLMRAYLYIKLKDDRTSHSLQRE